MRLVISIVSFVVAVLLTGCYLKQVDVVQDQGLTLDVTPEGPVVMSSVSAYQVGERLLVSGSIGQKEATSPFSGWVQVTVLNNGTVFEASCDRVWPKAAPGPRWHIPSNAGASVFDMTLPKVPPPGSVIRVTGSAQASLCT
jgi:hypothetical protein